MKHHAFSKLKVVVVFLVLSLIFSACAAPAVPAGGESAGDAADANGARQFEGTELNLLYFAMTYTNGLQELLPEFEEETGIKVNFELLDEQASVQKTQLELASGTGNYDLVGIQSGNMPLYGQNGWVTPVEEFYDTPLSDPDVLNLDDFIGSTMDAMKYEGVQNCLPMFAATTILYYRLDIFDEFGIDGPPATYDDLIEIASTVHTDEIPAIALRGSPQSPAGNVWSFGTFFYGEGAEYFTDFPNDMTPVVNSPEAITALENFIELKQNYAPEGVASYVFNDVVTAMQQGNVVMVIDGAPLAGRILNPDESKVIDKLGFAVVPAGADGQKAAFAAHGLCIAADSPNQEAAYKFLEWATSSETMRKVGLNSNHLAVTRNSVWEDPDFISKYDFDYGGGSFLKAYQDSLAVAVPEYHPPFAAWELIGQRMGQAVQEAEIGEKTPEEALNDANENMAQILRDEGYFSNSRFGVNRSC